MRIIISPYSRKLRNGGENPKNYPYWRELVGLLRGQGHEVIQVGQTGEEQIALDFRRDMSLPMLKMLVLGADAWVSVDNFFHHFCWSIGKKGVAIFTQSDPLIFGHKENVNLLKDRKYLREKQFDIWESAVNKPEAAIAPEEVAKAVNEC